MSKIKLLKASEIIDSRGYPTLEVECFLESGAEGKFGVPSGRSTGSHEAFELRDNDPKRFRGLGVLDALGNVNIEINNEVIGKDFDQESLDRFLISFDGTENKSRFGANAILGVSVSFAKAVACEQKKEIYQYLADLIGNKNLKLPQPCFNVINGGKHSDSGLDIQEFMLVPVGFDSLKEKIQVGAEIIYSLKQILIKKGCVISVGDEGGFAPKLESNEEAIKLIVEAIKDAGYSDEDVKIGLDVAATSFYKDNFYNLKIKGEFKKTTSGELINWYKELVDIYPIIFIEDGLFEDDFVGFKEMTEKLGQKIRVIGDDLLTTNVFRIKTAVLNQAVNSVLIKLNQIGTLTETIEAIELTKKQGWTPFISHRSGETIDTFISDLSVGLSCGMIKSGSLARGERVSKYNRLMEIEDNLK